MLITPKKEAALKRISEETGLSIDEPVNVDGVAISPLLWERLLELRKPTRGHPDGMKIWATKAIREETGLSLIESKKIADKLWPRLLIIPAPLGLC